MADIHDTPDGSGDKIIINAYITNTSDIDVIIDRLNKGEAAGVWHVFPTTKEALQAALQEIAVSGSEPQTIYAYDFETDISGLYGHLKMGADVDELNYLAHRLLYEVRPHNIPVFEGVMQSGRHCGSLRDIINVTENIDCFNVRPVFNAKEYGEFLADKEYASIATAMAKLEKLQDNDPDMCKLGVHITRLERYFDCETYAYDVIKEENGVFTDAGYLTESGEFVELYNTKHDIPNCCVVSTRPEPLPEERPSAIGRLEAAKGAVKANGADKPPPDKTKSHDADL